jgi:hypothetical protein
MRFLSGEKIQTKTIRFRTLGCWPATGAIESDAADLASIAAEPLAARLSERQGKVSDGDDGGTLELKKPQSVFETRSRNASAAGRNTSPGDKIVHGDRDRDCSPKANGMFEKSNFQRTADLVKLLNSVERGFSKCQTRDRHSRHFAHWK